MIESSALLSSLGSFIAQNVMNIVPICITYLFHLFFTVQGLRGCVQVRRNLVFLGYGGYIIKTVLNAIGLVALLVIWEGNHIDTENNYDYDNGIMISVLIALIISLIFHISCIIMVGQLIKEIDAGIFGSS